MLGVKHPGIHDIYQGNDDNYDADEHWYKAGLLWHKLFHVTIYKEFRHKNQKYTIESAMQEPNDPPHIASDTNQEEAIQQNRWVDYIALDAAVRAIQTMDHPSKEADGQMLFSHVVHQNMLAAYAQGQEQKDKEHAERLQQADIDPLTGLLNRRAIDDHYLTLQIDHNSGPFENRRPKPSDGAYLLHIDVDDFKSVNAAGGHKHGDEVLKGIASAMVATTRSADFRGRRGGDEFVIILPQITKTAAHTIAQRLRESAVPLGTTLTIALGAVDFKQSLDDNVHRLDQALYAAKNNGKDMVIDYDDFTQVNSQSDS